MESGMGLSFGSGNLIRSEVGEGNHGVGVKKKKIQQTVDYSVN